MSDTECDVSRKFGMMDVSGNPPVKCQSPDVTCPSSHVDGRGDVMTKNQSMLASSAQRQAMISSCDESLLEVTRGHFSDECEESDKESGAEWEDYLEEDCAKDQCSQSDDSACDRAPPQFLPPCPYCQMVPRDHPKFSELHKVALLMVARLLRGGSFCMLVLEDEENPTTQPLRVNFLTQPTSPEK